jgi:tRNA threonylcarbamoyl adenosine modification protein YeaZ
VKILGVDTALGACSAALVADGRVLARKHVEMVRGHAEALAPMVEGVMRDASLGFAALDRIAVTTGPGTFTGQRVGLAFARALGLALKKPVIGVTTLDAMAEEALAGNTASWVLVVADAKRGEVYLAARSGTGETLLAPLLAPLTELASIIAPLAVRHGPAVLVAGTAAEAAVPLLVAAGVSPLDSGVRQPDAVFVAKLAANAPEGAAPRPLYLRPPDAKLPSAP